MWAGACVKPEFRQEYRDTSALVMSKEWNIAAHEWCARVACEYFLLRAEQRDEWLSRSAKGLSLVTVLNKETKRCIDALRAE